MERREMMRVLAGAALAGIPGCGVAGLRRGAAGYEIPGRALDFLRRHAGGGYACWRDGSLVAAGGRGGTFPALSVTKTVAALAVARAATMGWLGLDEVVDFPEWRGRAPVTVRNLLNSCSGLPAGDRELYSARPRDKGAAALRLPQRRSPGSVFVYGPAAWEALGEFMKRRLADHGGSLSGLLDETLGRLGIRPGVWRSDGTGTRYLSTGLTCGLDDLGRLGSALAELARGRERAGVSPEVFRDLTAARTANPMFSAGIWWNRRAGTFRSRAVEPERSLHGEKPAGFWKNACLNPAARADWLSLVGSGGTRVYVLPAASVVVATARAGGRWSDAAALRALTFG